MTSEATVPEAAVEAFFAANHNPAAEMSSTERRQIINGFAAALPHLSTAIHDAALEEAPAALEEAIRLTEVGEYLYSACAYSYGDGFTEPREYGIEWQWQQTEPNQYGPGQLLAAAVKWHKDQAEAGTITEAAKLRDASAFHQRGLQWHPIDSAPEDCRVILATSGNWVGEAIMLRDEDTGEQVWTWVDTGRPSLHSCYGWMPLPDGLLAPVPSEGT